MERWIIISVHTDVNCGEKKTPHDDIPDDFSGIQESADQVRRLTRSPVIFTSNSLNPA